MNVRLLIRVCAVPIVAIACVDTPTAPRTQLIAQADIVRPSRMTLGATCATTFRALPLFDEQGRPIAGKQRVLVDGPCRMRGSRSASVHIDHVVTYLPNGSVIARASTRYDFDDGSTLSLDGETRLTAPSAAGVSELTFCFGRAHGSGIFAAVRGGSERGSGTVNFATLIGTYVSTMALEF